jgi:ethanolamine utilization protein EutM
VRAAVDAGAAAASQVGDLVSAHLIPRPEQSLLENFI